MEGNMISKEPSEIVSQSARGEILGPLHLPPELAALSDDWSKLTYAQRIADVKGRPLHERLLLLKSVGSICKNAIQVVREFRPIIEVCRDELSQPGRRVPIEGKPTWTEFIHETLGFTARRMQQLLSDGNPDSGVRPESSRQTRGAPPRPQTVPEDYQLLREVKDLALVLARRVVEQGLAEQFPEAGKILKLTGSNGSVQPSSSGTLVRTRTAEPGHSGEGGPITANNVGPQANCYICETGIYTCPLHEPELKALMAERGIDDCDASDILKRQFAKRGHVFSQTA